MKYNHYKLIFIFAMILLLCGCNRSDNEETAVDTEPKFIMTETEEKEKLDSAKEEPPASAETDSRELVAAAQETLISDIKNQKGVAENFEFLTCKGTEFQSYPDEAFGYVAHINVDIDGDGIEEIVLSSIEKGESTEADIVVTIYRYEEETYKENCSQVVAELSFCTKQRIALYRNETTNGYGIVVDQAYWGTYTRVSGKIGMIYLISEGADAIEQAGVWEVNSVIGWGVANIEQEFKNFGVPYAENCAEYNVGEDSLLCRIGYRVVDSENYTQIENYLSIGTNEGAVPEASPQWSPGETGKYHTGEELVEAARAYYTSIYGVEPPYVEIDTDSGDCVTIHLFDVVDGHTNTYDWYLVNRYSGEGNDFAGGFIDILE